MARSRPGWPTGPRPPPPPQGPIGSPTPEAEALAELLLDQSYSRRGEGYNGDWAFHQYAVQNGLGFPIGKSALIQVAGRATPTSRLRAIRSTTRCRTGAMSGACRDLLGGSIPPGGLGRALLDATYPRRRRDLPPRLGLPSVCAGQPARPADRRERERSRWMASSTAIQVFALDTLFNRVPNWTDIRRVSELAGATDPAMVRLRDALLAQTYARSGATYHSDWAFHQLARGWNVGAPLSDSYRVASGAGPVRHPGLRHRHAV